MTMVDQDYSDSDVESNESDRELQVAFSRGLLKPGLNIEAVEKPKSIINKAALKLTLSEISKANLPWIERLDLSVKPVAPPKPMRDELGKEPDVLSAEDVHDDFKREMRFYRQAQAAVMEGIPRLQSLGIPTQRPSDYFAEMAKSDEHMKKVRSNLLSKQAAIERSEKARKLRELRKYGKKVQQDVLLKRQKEKKEMLDAVKKFRKGKKDSLDIFGDDEKKKPARRESKKPKKDSTLPSKKRKLKNTKYGFGGQKKRSKYNTAESAADIFDGKKHKKTKPAGKFKGGNKNKRPGKRRRQNNKSRKN